jgi:CRP-like cAMP-binding protein
MTTEVPVLPAAAAPDPGAAAKHLLRQNYLFSGLPDALLNRVAVHAQWRDCRRNETVFSQGDEGDALYGVVSGRVRISTMSPEGREVFLNIMEPGDTFGEIAVIDGLPRTAGAVALDPATLIFIKRREFLDVVECEPVLAMHLLRLFCQRLRWTSDLVEESSFLFGPARLAKRLLVLAALHGHRSLWHGARDFPVRARPVPQYVAAARQSAAAGLAGKGLGVPRTRPHRREECGGTRP